MSAPSPPALRAGAPAARRRRADAGWNLVGLAVLVVMVFPVYWMVSTAFKPDDEINGLTPTWFSGAPDARRTSATRSTVRSSGTASRTA